MTSTTKLIEQRDEAQKVADVLLEENHVMSRKLEAARELARAKLREKGHGVECGCRLCLAALATLGIKRPPTQERMW